VASRNRVSSRTAPSIIGSGRIAAGRAVSAATGVVATVPAAPSAFAQTNANPVIGSGPSVVSWTAPNNGGATITSYSITYKWVSDDIGQTYDITLTTSSQAGTSYSIAEAASHAGTPNHAGVGSQPRWVEGNYGYTVIVQAVNSVGTGPAGTYFFNTGGGS